MSKNRKVPVEPSLFDIPASPDEPLLLNGSICTTCGRYFFPRVERCHLCGSTENVKNTKLGRKGKIWTYTNCCYAPPGGGYKGKVPFGLGLVALDEGIIICTRINETDTSKLKVGMETELMLETLYTDDEGNDVVCFTYNPKA
jgi:uncharacterized OB-fold protein